MRTQKTAVIEVILATLESRGIEFELNGPKTMKDVLGTDKSMKEEIVSELMNGFTDGDIQMKKSAADKHIGEGKESSLKKYVVGLVDNWVRKNPEFNSGESYAIKNKGSRAGQGDEEIKNLRLMKKTQTDEAVLAQIDEAIEARLTVIKPTAVVTINAEAIPEHLRHLL
jgi:hypothetical protein